MTEPIDLKQWVGRTETRVDWINPNHLAAWSATLDRDDPFPREGDPAPPGFHWTLFPPLARQSEIGHDGHAKRGGFLPPVALPRRMWAGGRLAFHRPLRVGERVERVSTIEKVEEKAGRSGALVFVLVKHRLSGEAGLALEEEHDIVYREAPKGDGGAASALEPAPEGAWRRRIVPDDVLLFRYSALTFNGHRIHYDRRYVTTEEGYPGLVVHGPLIATLLLDLVRRERQEAVIERFEFRALRPTFDTSPFELRGTPGDGSEPCRLWSTDNLGQAAMEAQAWLRAGGDAPDAGRGGHGARDAQDVSAPRFHPELCDRLATGDLVLFSGKGVGSAGIKWASTSRWSHVALVVRLPEHPQVMIWESTTLDDLPDRDTGTRRAGVQLVPLRGRAERYDGDIAFRRLEGVQLSETDLENLHALRGELKGRDYEHDEIEMIKAAWDGPFGHNAEDLASLFCSELVAEAYQRLGLLGQRKPSNEYIPADFSQRRRLKMLRGKLGEEVLIKVVEQ